MEIQQQLFESVACMLSDLAGSENDRLYEQWNARAIAMLERLKSPHNVHVAELSQLSRCHRLHADSLMLRGESDRARKELEEDLASRPVRAGCGNRVSRIRLERGVDSRGVGTMVGRIHASSIPDPPAASERRDPDLEPDLAELTARRIGWLPSIVKSPWLIPEDLPTEAWTDRVISSIKSDAAKFDLDHTRIPAIGWLMRHPVLRHARRGKDRSAISAMHTGSSIDYSRWPSGSRDRIRIKPPPTCF